MSVTITSKRALSILGRAASPPVTVSTLWPSRRSAMSSNSQMERSSSQTRMLPTSPSSSAGGSGNARLRSACRCGWEAHIHAPQTHHETRAFAYFRARPDFALMRLHDLIDDRQAQSSAAFKIRLERFEDFFRLLGTDAGTGIREADLPVRAAFHQ